MSLSGNLWPYHSGIQNGELLSSWISRLAIGNGVTYSYLCGQLFPYMTRPQADDIDLFWPRGFSAGLKILATRTALNISQVQKAACLAFDGHLENVPDHSGGHEKFWRQITKNYSSTVIRYGIQFCPKCLKEDDHPFFRKKWRLSLFYSCPKHGCLLFDRCPECLNPIDYRKLSHRHDSITNCLNCFTDLSEVERECCDCPADELSMQRKLDEILEKGWVKIEGYDWVYSHSYFEVLNNITVALCEPLDWRAKRFDKFKIYETLPFGFLSFSDKTTLDKLEFKYRRQLLINSYNLLSNLGECSNLYLFKSLPYWCFSIVERNQEKFPDVRCDYSNCANIEYIDKYIWMEKP